MAVDGKFKVITKTSLGERESVLELKSDGDELTGSITSADGSVEEITDGSVDGNTYFGFVDVSTPMGVMNATIEGTVEGDTLTGTVTLPIGTVLNSTGTRM